MSRSARRPPVTPKKVPPSAPRRTRAIGIAVAAVVLAIAAGWFVWLRPQPAASGGGVDLGALPRGVAASDLNVLVITLDTTRADHLGIYGDRTAGTPNLDRLGREGVLFEQAVTSAPLTLPAHATIFTGLLPPRHGIRDNGGYVLDPKHETLAHALKGAGWQTGAFVGAFVLDGKWGLNQGFDTYYDKFDLSKYRRISLADVARRGNEVVDQALPWLQAHASQRFFAWLHFYDAHSPYDPPEPFKSTFRGRPYAGEIAFVDAQVGRVLDWLRGAGLDDRTIVVVAGDHGESLNEHGEGTHALFVYDATVRVPLIVRAPFASMRGRRVPSIVRTADLMPTILDLVGRHAPGGVQGRSLVPLLVGSASDLNLDGYSESLYARHHFGWSELRALRSGRFKFIQSTKPELYDLDRDPGETANVYADRRSLADRLATELARLSVEENASASTPGATVDPETRERLAALGYVGTFTQSPRRQGETLPDPKDKIGIFNLMMGAHDAAAAEGSTLDRLKRVVAEDPEILDAWIMLGNEYSAKGDPHAALDAYKRAVALNPDYDLAIINMANTYRTLGDAAAARVGYERYLQHDPKNALVRYQLGEVYLEADELDRAEREFQQALSDDTRVASARNALAVVAFKRGDLPRAEQEVKAALAQKPDVKLAHFNLALIAEQRRQYDLAIEEYRRELEVYPGNFKAAFNMGKVYDRLGDRAAQEREYRKAIEINPSFAEGYFYLSKLFLDQGRSFDEAIALAKKGLEVGPASPYAPMGHYLLADLYNRAGRQNEADAQLKLGRELERRLGARAGRVG
jgi:arylsulfatase A-like enzyme/Tfp pilus assembly protein PilF